MALLPILVIAAWGAFSTPPWPAQFAVCAIVAAILVEWAREHPWTRAFAEGPHNRLRGVSIRSLRLSDGLIAIIASVGILAGTAIVLLAHLPEYDDRGGLASTFALAALIVWALSVLFSVVGFATSWARAAVAVLVGLVVVRALLVTGALRVRYDVGEPPALGLALVVLGIGFVVAAVFEGVRREPAPNHRHERWPSLAIGFALASTLLIFVALAWSTIEVHHRSSVVERGLVRAGAAGDLAQYSDTALALEFLPILRFDGRARWTPSSVENYVKRAYTIDPDAHDFAMAGPQNPPLAKLETPCLRGQPDPCRGLTLKCAQAGSVDNPCPPQQHHVPAAKPYQEGAVYVRVARMENDPDAFEAFGPDQITKALTVLVQYWFFYDYDEWSAPVVGGRIVQRHEGDWEAVTLGLAARGPLFVAFSEHCGGIWQDWRRVLVMNRPADEIIPVDGPDAQAGLAGGPRSWTEAREDPTHPVVQVAVGSQANYPPRLSSRAPNWASCQGFPSGAVPVISYASNIRDRTGSAFTWLPGKIYLVNRRTWPMDFPGTWGATDSTQFVTTIDDPNPKGGRGPATPSRQDLWLRPVRQIFCGRGWVGDHFARDPSCKA